MSNTAIGNAYLKVVPEVEGDGSSLGSKFGYQLNEGLTGSIGAGAVALGNIIADTVLGAAQTIGEEFSKTLWNYADYEQLVGGVDTLFKDASATVQANAARAFETAGMSANDYMENVTSFSASLIQSLEGDTTKAASIADKAMVDMSDNANKMGSSMESITNAYQGFAKQNYTMLDNLKLGYGGTKSEMERLLADASEIAGIEFNIDSYADVIEAIHVMQESMDITDTTMKEGSTTISGSLNQLHGAWENFLTVFGDGGQTLDMSAASDALMESLGAVVNNIIPALARIVSTAVTQLPGLLVGALTGLPSILGDAVAAAFGNDGGLVELFRSVFGDAAVDGLLSITDRLTEGLETVFEVFDTIGTTIMDSLGTIFAAFGDGMGESLGTPLDFFASILDETVLPLIESFAAFLNDAILPAFQQFAGYIASDVAPMVSEFGALVADLAEGALSVLGAYITDVVIPAASGLWAIIQDSVLPVFSSLVGHIVDNVVPTLMDMAGWVIDHVVPAFEDIAGMVGEHVVPIISDHLVPVFETVADFVTGTLVPAIEDLYEWFRDNILPVIKDVAEFISDNVMPVFTDLAGVAADVLGPALDTLGGILQTVFGFIKDVADAVSGLIGWFGDLATSASKALGTAAQAEAEAAANGVYVPAFATGGIVTRAALFEAGEKGTEFIWPSYEPYMTMYADALTERMGNKGDIVVNLNYQAGDDANDMLRDLARGIRQYRMAGVL